MKRFFVVAFLLLAFVTAANVGIMLATPTAATITTVSSSSNTSSSTSGAQGATAASSTTAQAQTAAAISEVTSNWAGYVSTGGTYTAVSGSWTVPNVSATDTSVAADAAWIGIGGTSSDDLIQIGTQDVVENGQVEQSAFYEELPDNSVSIPTITVSAGDVIHASITETSSGQWALSLQDQTTGASFSQTVAYASSESSAEWIEEAPSDASGVIALDEFGSISFSNASAVKNGQTVSLAASGATTVGLDNDAGEALATVSTVTGSSFTVARTDASNARDDEVAGGSGISSGFGRNGFEPGGSLRRGYSRYSQ